MLANDTTCIRNYGPSDGGHSVVGSLLSAAAIAAAAYNSVRAVELATKEWQMAMKYWKISNNWLDHYKNYYAPVEDQELSEAMNLEEPEPEYEVARGRARIVAWLQFKDVLNTAVRCTSRYCTGLRNDMLMDMSAAQADAVALADGMGYRNERAYLESRDDVRFDKMFNTAKRGRDMVSDNVSLAKTSAGIYGDLFDQAWEGLVGAGSYLGYQASRRDTVYPTTFVHDRATVKQKAITGEQSAGKTKGE